MKDQKPQKEEEGLFDVDPKKLFDPKEYNTIIVDTAGYSKKENETSTLIISLVEKEFTPEEKDEALKTIAEQKSQNLLVDTIRSAEDPSKKALLIAVCWECGLDFSNYFLFFAELACSSNFGMVMEACTVIDSIEDPIITADLEKGKALIAEKLKTKPDTSPLLQDVLEALQSKKSVN